MQSIEEAALAGYEAERAVLDIEIARLRLCVREQKPATKKPIALTAAIPVRMLQPPKAASATPAVPPAKKPMSAATRKKLSIAAKKRWARGEERKKMSASQSARWAVKNAGEKRTAHAGHRAAR